MPKISENEVVTELCIAVASFILSLLFTYRLDKCSRDHKLKHTHYPYSFNIITGEFPKIFQKKTVLSDYKEQNNEIDKIIKSPLEYATETLKGNQAPKFSPNDCYLEEIYASDTKLIVAVTAENPNLWLDPTLCFYLINCCAVSLIKNESNVAGKRMKMEDFVDATNVAYKTFTNSHDTSLDKLIKHEWDWNNDFQNFDFFRFFLYDGEKRVCLEKNVFPSLKATHDLFGIKSFFTEINEIESELRNGTENHLGDYHAHIDFIWDEISKQDTSPSFRRVINERKSNHWPEFLILFKTKENETNPTCCVTVHTFVNGKPYSIEFVKDSTNHLRGYTIVQSLISYLAKSVKNTPKYAPQDEFLNTKNSYIKWV
jgi:hypothetical protein